MDLDRLRQHRTAILEEWLNMICDTYPPLVSDLLKRGKDQFANPVGNIFSVQTGLIFDALVADVDSVKIAALVDSIIQVRVVQDCPPSEAISFVFLLKKATRQALGGELAEAMQEWPEFESRVDRLALIAMDVYAKYRDKVSELRINEMRNHRDAALRLVARADPLASDSDVEHEKTGGPGEDPVKR